MGSLNVSVGSLDMPGSPLTTRVRLVGKAGGRDSSAGALGHSASPNDTVVTTTGPPGITTGLGEVWTITATRKIAVNGVTDQVTSNVVELAYVNAVLWQLNTSGNWYSKPRASAPWSAATRISPLPPSPVGLAGSGSDSDGASGTLSATAAPRHPFAKAWALEFDE